MSKQTTILAAIALAVGGTCSALMIRPTPSAECGPNPISARCQEWQVAPIPILPSLSVTPGVSDYPASDLAEELPTGRYAQR